MKDNIDLTQNRDFRPRPIRSTTVGLVRGRYSAGMNRVIGKAFGSYSYPWSKEKPRYTNKGILPTGNGQSIKFSEGYDRVERDEECYCCGAYIGIPWERTGHLLCKTCDEDLSGTHQQDMFLATLYNQ